MQSCETLNTQMSFADEFESNLVSLAHVLQKKYALLRDLDKSLQEEAIDEQKHSVRIADEKVALAMQAYDLLKFAVRLFNKVNYFSDNVLLQVDMHVQQLDQYMKKSNEQMRREKENASASNLENSGEAGKAGEGRRGGRKNYGEMIACDNNECKIEWFHFGCVGLKDQPKGKWYCPDCATVKKSRKGR
ncbi:hypothetical protein HID58_025365 [Brassica napus]|uniref:Zinc finger PHD-type domain-containing protein n=1 Tax=Brassica napus TaxID=3708 RepID=A0ABQ8CKW0_BRANA|nr:hypothetical protein HID58_025365 [Brassica napus]